MRDEARIASLAYREKTCARLLSLADALDAQEAKMTNARRRLEDIVSVLRGLVEGK